MPPGRPKGVRLDSDLLKRRRETLGWTQGHLAAAAVVSPRVVQKAEGGQPIALETALGLCATLGVPYVEALEREPEEVAQALMLLGYAPLAEPSPFVGREATSARIARLFDMPAARVVLEGPAGIGKSSLARHLCGLLAGKFPDGVAWVRGKGLSTPTTRERAQRDLAEALAFFDRLPLPDLVPRRAYDLAFATRLWSRRRLLVIDDVVDPDVVALLQPDPAQGHVIVTARGHAVAEALGGEAVPVPPWSGAETRSFLERRLGKERLAADPAAVDTLVRAAGGVPGNAAEAANVLSARPALGIGAYLAEKPSWGQASGLALQASPEAAAFLTRLAVVGRSPFSLEWARALTDTDVETSTRLLSELSERYLVHRVEDWDGEEPSPRYHLDSRAQDLLEVEAADAERLIAAGVRMAETFDDVHPRLVHGRVARDLPLWSSVLDAMCQHAVLPDDVDLDDPTTLPRGQRYAGADGLPALLWNLRGAFRFGTTENAPRRLGVAAAVATDPLQFARIAGLMCWQLHYANRREAAARWVRAASEAFAVAGAPSQAARCAVYANFLDRFHLTPAEHLAACRRVEATWAPDHSALLATGTALLPIAPAEAILKLAEAGSGIDHLDDHSRKQVEAVIALQTGLAKRLSGQDDVDVAAIRRSVLYLREATRGEVLYAKWYNDLGRLVSGQDAFKPLDSGQILLTALPAMTRYRLNNLYDIAVALQGGHDGTAGVVQTSLGPLSPEMMFNVPPFSPDGFLAAIVLPLEPMASFLSGDGLTQALSFVAAAGGQSHPAWRALSALPR